MDTILVNVEERAHLCREKPGHVEYQEELAIGTLPGEKGRTGKEKKRTVFSYDRSVELMGNAEKGMVNKKAFLFI